MDYIHSFFAAYDIYCYHPGKRHLIAHKLAKVSPRLK